MELAITLVVGVATGFFGTIVGGSGLIVVPMLIFFGLSPQGAIATTIFGHLGQNTVGWREFHRSRMLNYRIAILGAVIVGAGAIMGAQIVLKIPGELLEKLIGVLILTMLGIVTFQKTNHVRHREVPLWKRILGYILFFPLGILSGMFAGGIAIIGTYILMFCFGQTFLESAATRKPIFFVRTVVAAVFFAVSGYVHWDFGITLILSQGIGSFFGARMAIRKGEGWVRVVFIVVTFLSAMELLIR